MIKFTILCLLLLTAGTIRSQILRPQVKKTTITTTTPAPPVSAPVYRLTAVRVNIKTGNDNKEFPSGLYIDLWQKGYPSANYPAYCLFKIHNWKNEMTINSSTDLGLEKYDGANEKFLLTTIQQKGLELKIGYIPNFFMDAWRIEGISCSLEFRDQNNNLHPTLGNKIIVFSNASGFLNNDYHTMKCLIDQNMNGLSASIEK